LRCKQPFRLSMTLMGQVFFSVELLGGFEPASIRGVALCRKGDAEPREAFESFPDTSVAIDGP
jgi:hypothetical protein